MKPSIFVDLNTVLSHQSSQITSVADYEINWISRGQELLYLPWRQPKQRELEHCPGEKVTALLQKASRALWKIHEAKIKITHTHTYFTYCEMQSDWLWKWHQSPINRHQPSKPVWAEIWWNREMEFHSRGQGLNRKRNRVPLQPPTSLRHRRQDLPFVWGKILFILPFPLLAAPKPMNSLEWLCFLHTELLQEAPPHHPKFEHKLKSCPRRTSLCQELHHLICVASWSELLWFSQPKHLIWQEENRNCHPRLGYSSTGAPCAPSPCDRTRLQLWPRSASLRFTEGTCTALLNRQNSTYFTPWLNCGPQTGMGTQTRASRSLTMTILN